MKGKNTFGQIERVAKENKGLLSGKIVVMVVINIKMILQKEKSGRQKQEQEYRKQLYNEVIQKSLSNNKSKYPNEPQQSFSLTKHIESQQMKRKNKEKSYYAELEKQRKQEMQLKIQKKQEEKQKQIEIDMKITHENQMLQKRFAEEKLKQQNKREVANDRAKELEQYYAKVEQDRTHKMSRVKNQNRNNVQQAQKFPNDSLDKIQNQPSKLELQSFPKFQEIPMTFAYPTRFENQSFNFPEKRQSYNHYQRELQLEKKKFDQQSSSLRELNKYLGEQRKNFTSRNRQGLESLKQLQKILDDQSINFANKFKKSNYQTSNRYKTTENGSHYFQA